MLRLMLRSRVAMAWLLVLVALTAAQAEPTNFPPAAREKYDQAQALMKQRRYQEAIQAYEDAIRLGMKDYPRAHLNKARSLLELEQYENAIRYFTEFLDRFGIEESCRY
jgi:tetratricopeptide (TPR) repeat protein